MSRFPEIKTLSKVKKIGRSYYIRVPKDIIELLKWDDNDRLLLEICVDGKSIPPNYKFCLVVSKWEWEHVRGEKEKGSPEGNSEKTG